MKVGMRQPYRGKATTHRYPVIVTVVFVAYTHKFESYGKRENSKSMTQSFGNNWTKASLNELRTKLSAANFICHIGQ
jgi:uncharacterized membrane protein